MSTLDQDPDDYLAEHADRLDEYVDEDDPLRPIVEDLIDDAKEGSE